MNSLLATGQRLVALADSPNLPVDACIEPAVRNNRPAY